MVQKSFSKSVLVVKGEGVRRTSQEQKSYEGVDVMERIGTCDTR